MPKLWRTGRDFAAARSFAAACAAGERKPEELDEALFASLSGLRRHPGPRLGDPPQRELRLSNFLLWQSAYAEFYFTDVLWPDFDKAELDRAIAAYHQRDRRFGGVKK